MTLYLAADHLVEISPVAATCQRIRGDELLKLVLSGGKVRVRHPQLVCHVFEGHELHAEGGDEVQGQIDERQTSEGIGRGTCADEQPGVRDGERDERCADYGRA